MQRPRNDHKAARLVALLPLWRSGQLDGETQRNLAIKIGCHPSTMCRLVQKMPAVDALVKCYESLLSGAPVVRRRRKKRNR